MNGQIEQETRVYLHDRFSKWANTPITVDILLEWELYLVIASSFLHSFGLPTIINDILCFANLVLVLFSLSKIARVVNRHPAIACVGAILLIYSILSAVFNGISPLNAVWQFIAFSRPFVYGFVALAYWDTERFERVFRRLVGLQWLNAFCAAFEFLILGMYQDLVGGMFGSWLGCNLPLNIYLCLVTAAMFSAYLNQRWNVDLKTLLISCLCSLGIAAISELKFFFIEFIIISICAFILCRPTLKKFVLILFAALIFFAGFSLFGYIFPDRAANMLDFDTLYGEANLRGAGYPISRVEVYKDLGRIIFADEPRQQIVGLGLGASANSSIGIFTSPLSILYANYKLGLLQSVMLCIDLGYIGTALYFTLLASLAVRAWVNRVKDPFMSLFSIIVIVVFAINVYYNNTASSANSLFWALPLVCCLARYPKSRDESDPSEKKLQRRCL